MHRWKRNGRSAPADHVFASFGRLLAAVLVVAGLGACADMPPRLAGFEERVEQNDFYVPPAFNLRTSHQWSQVPDFRHWFAEYVGGRSINDVEPSLVKEMPRLGWQLADVQRRADGTRAILFFKGDEQARVELRREYDGKIGGMATVIAAQIGPRSIESFETGALSAESAHVATETAPLREGREASRMTGAPTIPAAAFERAAPGRASSGRAAAAAGSAVAGTHPAASSDEPSTAATSGYDDEAAQAEDELVDDAHE